MAPKCGLIGYVPYRPTRFKHTHCIDIYQIGWKGIFVKVEGQMKLFAPRKDYLDCQWDQIQQNENTIFLGALFKNDGLGDGHTIIFYGLINLIHFCDAIFISLT